MLYRAADADRDVQAGVYRLSSLSDLHAVRNLVPSVYRRPTGPYRGTDDIRDLVEMGEVGRITHSPPTGDDNVRFYHIEPFAGLGDGLPYRDADVGRLSDCRDICVPAVTRCLEGIRPQGQSAGSRDSHRLNRLA